MEDFVFNVATLVQEPPGSGRTYDVLAPPEALGVAELIGPVAGHAQFVRLQEAVHVSGTLAAPVEQPCARCLEPARSTVSFAVDDDFAITEGEDAAGAEALESSWQLDDRHNLDLSPLLAEGVIAALPLMPVCHPDCRGLGAENAPEGAAIDPRWRELAELRDTMFPDAPSSRR
jgi:uncharacterized protein